MPDQDVYDWLEERFPYDGPHSRDSVIDASVVVSRLIRYLNNATQPGIAKRTLEWANTTDQIVGNLAGAAYGQQQLLEQLADRMSVQARDDATLYDDRRVDDHPGADTATRAATCLTEAIVSTEALGAVLDHARSHTVHLGNQ